MKRILILIPLLLIKGYKLLISPLLGNRCRFYPSCADYAREALEVHGLWRGSGLALKRIARCQPLCEGGIDPVPPSNAAPQTETQSP